jgi:DNA-binding CsgD family transcriptional regulator
MLTQSLAQKDGQRGCEFSQQDQKGHWYCGVLELSGQPCAIVTPRMRIKWATTSADKLLQRYWPAHTGVKTQLPPQIHQWLTMCRKQMGPKGKSPIIKLAPLTINRPSACLTVRLIRNCTLSALLFEELLLELPADFLVAHGLTPREAEVLRWIAQGKSSLEIARILNISDRTVSKHLERVYLRLGVENRHAAIALVHDELRRNASGR